MGSLPPELDVPIPDGFRMRALSPGIRCSALAVYDFNLGFDVKECDLSARSGTPVRRGSDSWASPLLNMLTLEITAASVNRHPRLHLLTAVEDYSWRIILPPGSCGPHGWIQNLLQLYEKAVRGFVVDQHSRDFGCHPLRRAKQLRP